MTRKDIASYLVLFCLLGLTLGFIYLVERNSPKGEIVGTVRSGEKEYTRYCVDGVEYIKIEKGVAPYFRPDGTLHLCGKTDGQEG